LLQADVSWCKYKRIVKFFHNCSWFFFIGLTALTTQCQKIAFTPIWFNNKLNLELWYFIPLQLFPHLSIFHWEFWPANISWGLFWSGLHKLWISDCHGEDLSFGMVTSLGSRSRLTLHQPIVEWK
jgi:hypothetical protein